MTDNNLISVRPHRGVSIFIRVHDGQFCATPIDGGATVIRSEMSELVESIDRALDTVAKAAKRTISISLLNSKGEAVTVTGIHASHGKLLVKPAKGESQSYYPVADWVARDLQRLIDLTKEDEAIRSRLRSVAIGSELVNYSTRRNGFDYEAEARRLEASVAEALRRTALNPLIGGV